MVKAAGVKQSTGYGWLAKQNQPEKQRGGQRILKISQQHHVFMEQLIEQNPTITLNEMKIKLKEEYNVNVYKECVRLHLDGLLYTLKDLRRKSENANNDTNKIKRYDYVKHLLDYQAENIPIIYIYIYR